MGVGQGLLAWAVAGFCLEVFIPAMIGSYRAIWQSRVPPEVQGWVFAARNLLNTVLEPVATVAGGLLADRVFEPALRPGGSLAPLLGGMVGVGPDAGMGLMLVIGGLLTAVVGLAGYAFRSVRAVENILPDHDAGGKVETAG